MVSVSVCAKDAKTDPYAGPEGRAQLQRHTGRRGDGMRPNQRPNDPVWGQCAVCSKPWPRRAYYHCGRCTEKCMCRGCWYEHQDVCRGPNSLQAVAVLEADASFARGTALGSSKAAGTRVNLAADAARLRCGRTESSGLGPPGSSSVVGSPSMTKDWQVCEFGCDLSDWQWAGCTGLCRFEAGHDGPDAMHVCDSCWRSWQGLDEKARLRHLPTAAFLGLVEATVAADVLAVPGRGAGVVAHQHCPQPLTYAPPCPGYGDMTHGPEAGTHDQRMFARLQADESEITKLEDEARPAGRRLFGCCPEAVRERATVCAYCLQEFTENQRQVRCPSCRELFHTVHY